MTVATTFGTVQQEMRRTRLSSDQHLGLEFDSWLGDMNSSRKITEWYLRIRSCRSGKVTSEDKVRLGCLLFFTKYYFLKTYWGVVTWLQYFLTSTLDSRKHLTSLSGRCTSMETASQKLLHGGGGRARHRSGLGAVVNRKTLVGAWTWTRFAKPSLYNNRAHILSISQQIPSHCFVSHLAISKTSAQQYNHPDLNSEYFHKSGMFMLRTGT